jgi:hypothetical protein
MKKTLFGIIVFVLGLLCFSQNSMKPVEQLINKDDSAWPIVLEWANEAKNKVEILPYDTEKAKDALYKTQVTTKSPMGAIIFNSGGIFIDDGWIRILGSGSERLKRSLPEWNKGKTFSIYGESPKYLLVADDVIGGFFAINGGGIDQKNQGIFYYLAPDTLKWETLNINYSQFILFCFSGKIDIFYKDFRWKKWKDDIKNINGDQAYSFYPFLFTKEGKNTEDDSKKPISIDETWRFINTQ